MQRLEAGRRFAIEGAAQPPERDEERESAEHEPAQPLPQPVGRRVVADAHGGNDVDRTGDG